MSNLRLEFFLFFFLFLSYQVCSQSGSDISNEHGIKFLKLSWSDVIKEAKAQNKYIFVDCYATWCLPCKKMDREVFSDRRIGDFINANFISLRIQMDTSAADDAFVKSWYHEAYQLKERYKVKAFPSFLFFTPNGKIVHRYLSSLTESDFLKVAKNALLPSQQYYTLLENYGTGNLNKSNLGYLATVSKQIGNDTLADSIAVDYLHNYLDTISIDKLIQKKHFDFVSMFAGLVTSRDKVFKVMFENANAIDKLVSQKGFAQSFILNVITKEYINPELWPNKKPTLSAPNWNRLRTKIKKKFNNYFSELAVIDAQINWYGQKDDWSKLVKYWVKKNDNYGLDTAGMGWVFINNFAWDYVFIHCKNKDTLNKVASWLEIILESHPDDYVTMDTYANLLFKAGRQNEAIIWEEKALLLEEVDARKKNRQADKSFKRTLDKMRAGVPTWVVR